MNPVNVVAGGVDGSKHLEVMLGNYAGNGVATTKLEQMLNTCTGKTYDISLRYYAVQVQVESHIYAGLTRLPDIFNNYMTGVEKAGLRNWVTTTHSFVAKGPATPLWITFNTRAFKLQIFRFDEVVVTERL